MNIASDPYINVPSKRCIGWLMAHTRPIAHTHAAAANTSVKVDIAPQFASPWAQRLAESYLNQIASLQDPDLESYGAQTLFPTFLSVKPHRRGWPTFKFNGSTPMDPLGWPSHPHPNQPPFAGLGRLHRDRRGAPRAIRCIVAGEQWRCGKPSRCSYRALP
jgi:hypothetical protein